MVNRQHFKATPLANILKRSLHVTPVEDERGKIQVSATRFFFSKLRYFKL
jgi:hypothetical protein